MSGKSKEGGKDAVALAVDALRGELATLELGREQAASRHSAAAEGLVAARNRRKVLIAADARADLAPINGEIAELDATRSATADLITDFDEQAADAADRLVAALEAAQRVEISDRMISIAKTVMSAAADLEAALVPAGRTLGRIFTALAEDVEIATFAERAENGTAIGLPSDRNALVASGDVGGRLDLARVILAAAIEKAFPAAFACRLAGDGSAFYYSLDRAVDVSQPMIGYQFDVASGGAAMLETGSVSAIEAADRLINRPLLARAAAIRDGSAAPDYALPPTPPAPEADRPTQIYALANFKFSAIHGREATVVPAGTFATMHPAIAELAISRGVAVDATADDFDETYEKHPPPDRGPGAFTVDLSDAVDLGRGLLGGVEPPRPVLAPPEPKPHGSIRWDSEEHMSQFMKEL